MKILQGNSTKWKFQNIYQKEKLYKGKKNETVN